MGGLVETPDCWKLPLNGREVTQFQVDYAVTLVLGGASGSFYVKRGISSVRMACGWCHFPPASWRFLGAGEQRFGTLMRLCQARTSAATTTRTGDRRIDATPGEHKIGVASRSSTSRIERVLAQRQQGAALTTSRR